MNRLKELREKAKLSQAQLAKKARISQPQVARMEHPVDHPNYRSMSTDHARQLAAALKVTVFELTGSLDAAAEGLPEREIIRIGKWIESIQAER